MIYFHLWIIVWQTLIWKDVPVLVVIQLKKLNKFANFFSNIGSESSFSKKYIKMNCNTINDVRGETLNMEFQSCTGEEVRKVVQSLKSNSSSVDGFPLWANKVILGYIHSHEGHSHSQGGSEVDIENWRPYQF